MSLLDTASLIVTPNGYKEGKLYSVIPTDGSGDLSVTRATTATRVNSAGLVELVPYNLFTYSEQFDNADWSKSSGTITANSTTAPNGTNTADLFTANGVLGVHDFFQGFTGGSQTTASIYVKKNTAQYVYISLNYQSSGVNWATGIYNLDALTTATFQSGGVTNQVATISDESNGWRRITLKVDTANTTLFCMYGVSDSMSPTLSSRGRVENSSSASFYAWGAQLVEGSVAKDYQKTETRLNIPRLDYSNGTCPSILVEPQRTNLVTYSEDFNSSNGYTYQNASFSSSSIVSPSGLTAKGITSTTSANDFHRFYKSLGGLTGTYTTTIYGKKGTSRYLGLGINQNGSTGNNNVVVFDLQDGVIASNIYGVTASIQDVGNGWYRCEHTFNYGTGGTYADICVHNTGTGAFTINAFQTFDSPTAPTTLYIYGLQLEAGSYATSYIPTTSASVTRNADVISKTGISSLIGQTEGTLFVDFYNYGNNSTTTGCPICIANGGFYGNAIYIEQYLGNWYAVVWNGSSQQFISPPLSLSVGRHKLALAYKSNDIAFYSDGVLVGTDTSATIPTCDGAYIGAVGTSTTPEQLAVNASALWKTRLSNTQLAQLTTI